MTRTIGFLLVASLLSLAPGCGEKSKKWSQVEESAGKTWSAVKTWSAEKREEAGVFFQQRMKDLEPKLKAAREKAAQVGEGASKALEAKAKTAAKALEVLKDATGENWEKARDAFARAFEDLKEYVTSLDD